MCATSPFPAHARLHIRFRSNWPCLDCFFFLWGKSNFLAFNGRKVDGTECNVFVNDFILWDQMLILITNEGMWLTKLSTTFLLRFFSFFSAVYITGCPSMLINFPFIVRLEPFRLFVSKPQIWMKVNSPGIGPHFNIVQYAPSLVFVSL